MRNLAEIITKWINQRWVDPQDSLDRLGRELVKFNDQLVADSVVNEDAWGSVWLCGNWYWLTKNMTMPEREHAAECVESWSRRLNSGVTPDSEHLRWWIVD